MSYCTSSTPIHSFITKKTDSPQKLIPPTIKSAEGISLYHVYIKHDDSENLQNKAARKTDKVPPKKC